MSIAAPIEPPNAAAAAQTTGLLFERHSTRLFAFCLRRLRTREEAEDALQQTFMKAFAAVRGGFVPAADKAWLYRIAENVCTDRLRAATYRSRHESAPEALAAVAAPAGSALEGIGDALAGLGEHQRRAIVLREWHGLSYREIARELSLSQSAVETLLFRARRSLARRLEAVSFAGWVKSALAGGGAAKVAAVAVATIGLGALAVPATVDRLREQLGDRPAAPAVSNPTEPPIPEPVPAAPAQARDTETQSPSAGNERIVPAESRRSEAQTAPTAGPATRLAGVGVSESQSPDPAQSAPPVELPAPALPPLPETPPLPPPPLPEIAVPTPEEVLEPLGEAAVPELPDLPTLP